MLLGVLNIARELAPPLNRSLEKKRSVIFNRRILVEDHTPLRGTHMVKSRKFWSNHAEDISLISLVMIGTLALYLFAAYLIIAVL